MHELAPAAAVDVVEARDAVGDGRIPFRIRIGVTGHKTFEQSDALVEALDEQIRAIRELVGSAETPVELAVVSQLAEGADRLVVERVRNAAPARLEVILPFPRDTYVQTQELDAGSAHELRQLLDEASWVYEPPPGEAGSNEDAYEAAGRRLLARCDVLIALWDGGRSGGKGGTADTLLEAAWRRRPCIWLSTSGDPHVESNFRRPREFLLDVRRRAGGDRVELPEPNPGDEPLRSIRDAFAGLDAFNRGHVHGDLGARAVSELGPDADSSQWVVGAFARAAELADRYQRRFRQLAWTISIFITAAAATLAASIAFEDYPFAWAETACLALAGIVFWIMRRLELRARWLSARVLAERLRAAFYVAPTRRDFRRVAGMESVFTERHSGDWVERASEEVWDLRPERSMLDGTLSDEEAEQVRARMAEWIVSQIAYHERSAARHARRDRVYAVAVIGLLALAVLFAMLDAAHVQREIALFLAITCPAAGAALGALRTVAQHRALSQRSLRMRSDLVVALGAVLGADSTQLGAASLEAARIMSQEAGDWFGTMWFLDVEPV